MYVTIKKTTLNTVSQDKSLREMLNELLIESDVAVTAVAEEIGINKDSFSEYLKGNYELKLNQAIKVMISQKLNLFQLIIKKLAKRIWQILKSLKDCLMC